MSVDKERLAAHLEDYLKVTGQKTERFVCPITLKECHEQELIEGHILNNAFVKASRRRVIQYRLVDNFYGTRAERDLVRFLNLKYFNDLDILRNSRQLKVTLPDGSCVEAFCAESPAARHADGRFPLVDLIKNGKPYTSVYLKIPHDSPPISGQIEVTKTEVFAPYDWVASLLKAGHLVLFDMLGYAAIYDPYGDTIRRSLNQFFEDRAPRKKAEHYFRDFRDAVKVLATRSDDEGTAQVGDAFPVDTLDDREVLLHFTANGAMFAVTCIFKVNEATITVALPQSSPGTDPAVVLDWYRCCTQNPLSRPQRVHRSRFDGTAWQTEQKPLTIGALPGG